MQRIVVTYREVLYETPSAIIWKKLRREFENCRKFIFFKPKKSKKLIETGFDYLYQEILYKNLIRRNIISSVNGRKSLFYFSKKDWEILKSLWNKTWEREYGKYSAVEWPQYCPETEIEEVVEESYIKALKLNIFFLEKLANKLKAKTIVDLHCGIDNELCFEICSAMKGIKRIANILAEEFSNICEIKVEENPLVIKNTNYIGIEMYFPESSLKEREKTWFLPRPKIVNDIYYLPKFQERISINSNVKKFIEMYHIISKRFLNLMI